MFLEFGYALAAIARLTHRRANFYQPQLQCFCTLPLAFLRLLPCAYNSANTFRKTSKHPVFLSLGIFPPWHVPHLCNGFNTSVKRRYLHFGDNCHTHESTHSWPTNLQLSTSRCKKLQPPFKSVPQHGGHTVGKECQQSCEIGF